MEIHIIPMHISSTLRTQLQVCVMVATIMTILLRTVMKPPWLIKDRNSRPEVGL